MKPPLADDESQKIVRNFRLVGLVSAAVLALGSVFYVVVEKLSWLDAVYFCVITLTTIGYGDIVPRTDAGKFFTIFYVIVGVGIIATLVNLTVKRAVVGRRRK